MVWRKRKEQANPTKLIPSSGAAGTSAQAVELPSHRLGPAVPQNHDSSVDSWNPDTREFTIPARLATSKRPYVLPRNYRISGDLASDRQVIVQGEFLSGLLDAPNVLVAPGGVVRDSLVASNLQVAGTVDANVRVESCVEISGRGRVSGSVKAPMIKAAPGARLEGCELQVVRG